eukprot:257120_1
MTFCVFCSENVPSDQLETHMNQYHSTFLPSHSISRIKRTPDHSFNSKHILPSTHHITPPISSVGHVYDPDILKPLCFLDGKRIKENIKKHKREEKVSKHNKRPYKRRKLNDFSSDAHTMDTKLKKKTKNKRKKKKKQESAEQQHTAAECEVEEEGEEDAYGGLPYHFHLATHCEPRFDPNEAIHSPRHTNIKSLLNPQHKTSQIRTQTNHEVPPTTTPCAFNPIHYQSNDHLTLGMNDRDHEWTKQLIQSYDRIRTHHKKERQDHWSDGEDVTQCVVYPKEFGMDDKALNALVLADLEQYNFIVNPLNEEMLSRETQQQMEASVSSDIPPLVTVPEPDSPDIIINPPLKVTKPPIKTYAMKRRTRCSSSAEAIVNHTMDNTSSHLMLPTLQTPKQTHHPSPNISNIPPLKTPMMMGPSRRQNGSTMNGNLSLINMNNLNKIVHMAQNKNLAQNINIGANSQNVTVLKLNQINEMMNAQQQKKQASFHRFNRPNNMMNNGSHMHRVNGHATTNTQQIVSIQDAMNGNPNASPTSSITTSNSTNSMNSTNTMNAMNMMNDNDDQNGNNNAMMMRQGIMNLLRKKLMNQNANPTFQQQLNGNYTLARYHQEVNGKNNGNHNNNNLSLLNNFNVNKFK